MMRSINQWRDKTRDLLHRASHFLGETTGIKPDSMATLSRANESLTMDLPSVTDLLPYETMDSDGFFINRNSKGFGLMLLPMAGADESLMKSLSALFKNKLTEGTDCTVMLYKHPWLESDLAQSYQPILKQGGIYAELARMSLKYHLNAIKKGYKNGRNIPANLADYRGYLFISRPHEQDGTRRLKHLREEFESELKVMGFGFARIEATDFKVLMRALLSPNFNDTAWPDVPESKGLIKEGMLNPSSVYEISDSRLEISLADEEGFLQKTRVVNCQISEYPKDPFALWQTPDFFANLLLPEHGIQCPFLLSFSIRGVNQEKVKARAKHRAKSASANNNAVQSFINPSIKDEAAEWRFVHEHASKGELQLLPTFYNLVLYTTEEKEREHIAKAIASYRQMDFTLTQSRCKQWIRFLGSLPFMLTEGLFSKMELLGITKKLSNYNVANLLPVIADFKGSRQGLLLPTNRHQLFYFDPFDDKNLPITNFNRLTVASAGAGKSYFQAALLLDGLSRGHQIFVIDLGDSYKHLCQLVGGTYIDATTISLNPFTLFDFDGSIEIDGEKVNNTVQMRDLLAIMASPKGQLDEVQLAWLLDALVMTRKRKGNQAIIDDVLDALREILQRPEAKDDRRLSDLVVLLAQFGTDGAFGYLCNGKTPQLKDSRFTVIELGGFRDTPDLLTIVMFLMIVIIQGQFYASDRRLFKQCNFDELWRALENCLNPMTANFLNHGYRTARKYNAGFSSVTQNLEDTEATPQGRAIANSSDTKFIMRQGALDKYIAKYPDSFTQLQQDMIKSFGEAKIQGFSNLMIQFNQSCSFHRLFSDPFSRSLFSTSGDEYGAIEALVASGMPLAEAVGKVAHHYHGDSECV
jgi:conjugal transfer ATP-binding protein TraC